MLWRPCLRYQALIMTPDSPSNQRTNSADIAERLCAATFGSVGAAHFAGSDPRLHVCDTDALAAIVDEAKEQGVIDQALMTDSIVFFCQALGLGAHSMERIGKGAEQWPALMELVLKAFGPQQ